MVHVQCRIPSLPNVFTSDEYRAWLSRTPSTSAIYEQIRASRDVLNQQRAARFTFSAENIHDALKQVSLSTPTLPVECLKKTFFPGV